MIIIKLHSRFQSEITDIAGIESSERMRKKLQGIQLMLVRIKVEIIMSHTIGNADFRSEKVAIGIFHFQIGIT